MDPTALVAFLLLIFLIVVAVLSVAVDSEKVKALQAKVIELQEGKVGSDKECYQRGYSCGYRVGCNDGFHYANDWQQEYQYVAAYVEEDD